MRNLDLCFLPFDLNCEGICHCQFYFQLPSKCSDFTELETFFSVIPTVLIWLTFGITCVKINCFGRESSLCLGVHLSSVTAGASVPRLSCIIKGSATQTCASKWSTQEQSRTEHFEFLPS